MDETTESKINDIHVWMTELKGELALFKETCRLRHDSIDNQMEVLDKDLNGNGHPGLKDKHQTLTDRFNQLETRIFMGVTLITIAFQFIPDVIKAIK